MTSAFDAAWTKNLAGGHSQEQARDQLAKRIMRAVDQGDTDAERSLLWRSSFLMAACRPTDPAVLPTFQEI